MPLLSHISDATFPRPSSFAAALDSALLLASKTEGAAD
jgi:hypothetical protein